MSEITRPTFTLLDAVKKVQHLTEANAALTKEVAQLKESGQAPVKFKAPFPEERLINLGLRIHRCALKSYIYDLNLHIEFPHENFGPSDFPNYREIHAEIEVELLKREIELNPQYDAKRLAGLKVENASLAEEVSLYKLLARSTEKKLMRLTSPRTYERLPTEKIENKPCQN